MNEIKYPISLNYRENWSEWESIREIIQNVLDLKSEEMEIYKENGNLIIRDYGKGMKIKHFLLGVSEKEDEDSRGQFGEGLKIALIVLKRLGYDVEIRSKNIRAITKIEEIESEKCLKIEYEKLDEEINGTKVKIKGYTGKTYKDRFVNQFSDDKNIIFEKYNEQIIKEEDSKLYIKDIFIQDLENSYYSYNLTNVELTESRDIADMYSIKDEIAKLIGKTNDKEMIKKYLEIFESGKYLESELTLKKWYVNNWEKWKECFKEKFGKKAVIMTDEEHKKEANWQKANVKELKALKEITILPTDEEYLRERAEQKVKKVKLKNLTEKERNNLRALKRYAKKTNSDIKIIPVEYPNLINDTEGRAKYRENLMEIRRDLLSNKKKSVKTLVHELGHLENGSKDLTQQHLRAIEKVASDIIMN